MRPAGQHRATRCGGGNTSSNPTAASCLCQCMRTWFGEPAYSVFLTLPTACMTTVSAAACLACPHSSCCYDEQERVDDDAPAPPAAPVALPRQVVCTQPRRVAAITVAEQVAGQMGAALGGLVGYGVRFDSAQDQVRCSWGRAAGQGQGGCVCLCNQGWGSCCSAACHSRNSCLPPSAVCVS
jgi:hypothetical protein